MGKEVMIDNIKGFPGYHITRDGLLYSRYDKKGRLTDEYHQNKIYTRSNGYQQAVLKIRKLNLLRRAYISNPLNKPCVCHRDNIRTHNWVDNLYWGSVEDNIRDRKGRYEIGDITRYKLRTGLHKSMVKICVKYLRDLGYSWKDIRIALHLSRVAIEKYKKP